MKLKTISGFVAKRITLSKEALQIANNFQKTASFRSLSETIEEILRRLDSIKQDGTLTAVNIHLDRFGICCRETEKTWV